MATFNEAAINNLMPVLQLTHFQNLPNFIRVFEDILVGLRPMFFHRRFNSQVQIIRFVQVFQSFIDHHRLVASYYPIQMSSTYGFSTQEI